MFRLIRLLKVEPSHVSDMAAELGIEIHEFVHELAKEIGRATSPADRQRVLDSATAALTELLAAAYGLGFRGALD